MILRRASDRYKQESSEFAAHEDGLAHVFFRNFGTGAEKSSDFIAIFDWADVEAIASALAAKGNPEASRFVHAMNMARAIEHFSRNSN
jgi:hypothetical protein